MRIFMVEQVYNYDTGTIEVRCENQLAIKLTKNPTYLQRTKHIEFKYLFTGNEVQNNRFTVTFPRTDDIVAGALTRAPSHAKNNICPKGFGFTNFP